MWLFRLTAMVLAPVLFLGVLEAGLRLGGYGYPTAFFVPGVAAGSYGSNARYGWRFFPHSLARSPIPNFLSAKPAGTIRIFVLGSSAAQGVPNYSFSFCRILETLLQGRYPEVKFELVNTGMTAINSHVVLDIARDCAAYQPDLFVVYMGNNEIVGPYGPGTVFQLWSPSLKFIRANIWVKSTRIGQMLDNAIQRLRVKDGTPTSWRGLKMFLDNQVAADDPRLAAVYGNFRQNLIDICKVGRRAGAAVLLSTVAVNLRDCPPFASRHRPDLSPEDLTKWESVYRAGVDQESKSRWEEALKQYEAAEQIDDRFAELQFRLGRCLAALGRREKARDRFTLARDLDILRFRADSKINAIIREVAAEQASLGVRGGDAEQALADGDPTHSGIPGKELFYEHVHLTFDGNYLVARAILEQVEAALPQLAASRGTEPVPSRNRCAELLALTTWDEHEMAALMMGMTSEPPFTNQLDHERRQASMQEDVVRLSKAASTPEALRKSCSLYEAALERTPDDLALHHRFAKLAMAMKQPLTALQHLRLVLKKEPLEPMVLNDLGTCLNDCGKTDEAVTYYRKALEVDPQFVVAYNNLANVFERRGSLEEAIAHYEKALEIDPRLPLAQFNLAQVLVKCERWDEAIEHYQKAVELSPGFVLAHNSFGVVLASRGRLAEAIDHFSKALKANPNFMPARSNLERARAEQNAPPARAKSE
jgi:tetratricopeptide (TPR) repeat protein